MKRENGARMAEESKEIGLGKKIGLLYGVCLIVGSMIGTVFSVEMYCMYGMCSLNKSGLNKLIIYVLYTFVV